MTQAPASTTLPRREDIPIEHTWNAESVYADRAAFQEEYESLKESLSSIDDYRGRLHEGPDVLADWLDIFAEIYKRLARLVVYARMCAASNNEDQEAMAMAGQAVGLMGQATSQAGFMDPEILAIGRETLTEWMENEPRIAYMDHYIDDLFRKQEHIRSTEVEEVLNMLVDPFWSMMDTREMLLSVDFGFSPALNTAGEDHLVAPSTLEALMGNPDREVRRTAWESYADGCLSIKNTLANNLTTMMKLELVNVRARRYDSALASALYEDNIPAEVYYNIIDTFKEHLPVWQRYWDVRRKALGVDTLHPYDVWAPLHKNQIEIDYEQAVDWIYEGMKPLSEDYAEILRRGSLEERWVDRYPNIGKGEAQFSSGAPGTHPFIMLKYNNNIGSMSVLAHELGHSMHSYYSRSHQPVPYMGYTMFVAETASNFNQAMVRSYLLNTIDDPDFQILVLEEAFANFHRYFFTMPTLARFELEVHQRMEQGRSVTANDMIELMADLYEDAYGDGVHIDRERVGINWAQYGHLYAPFYVFNYIAGISAANALAQRVLTEGPDAAEAYLNMLKAGSSTYPLDTLKSAGVDMSTPEPMVAAFEVLSGYIDRLEELTS